MSLALLSDSGFWLFSWMSGLTEGETLRSWTVLLSLISVIGLAEVAITAATFRAAESKDEQTLDKELT